MGLSVTLVPNCQAFVGTMKFAIADITFDSSYPTGGELFPKEQVGMGTLHGIYPVGIADATSGGVIPALVPSTGKVMAMRGNVSAHSHDLLLKNAAVADSAGARVNAGTNLLGANTGADITVAGGGANGGVQVSVAAQAALVEVANATNLSTVTVRVLIIGS